MKLIDASYIAAPRLYLRRVVDDALSATKVNIGPGKNWRKPGWTTLDYYSEADIHCDLREAPRLPLPSHSVQKIFCSHVIEHLPEPAADALFSECHRILNDGGFLRLSCPDLEKAVAQYRAGQTDPKNEVVTRTMRDAPSHLKLLNVAASFRSDIYHGIRNTTDHVYAGGPITSKEEVDEKLTTLSLDQFATWCHSMIPADATYRAHINAFWPERLLWKLRQAGFADVYVSRFRKSRDVEMRGPLFDNRPRISLFVEARARGRTKRVITALRVADRIVRDTLRKI